MNGTIPFVAEGPFAILAGAGLSAPAPTCLPGWWGLNDAVLGALGLQIERVARRTGLSAGFRDAIRRRRDSTPFLMPDLQAQLLEDELGPDYFRALSAVDSPEPNAAHRLLAELARQGRLEAVLTTNFDGAIERAFEAANVPYERYTSPEDFERLGEHPRGVRIVKIHGSADRPETMVDTLRQRLQGRPASLERWMHELFCRVPTLSLGFSCEDLQYDPDYLAIRPAMKDGAHFRFLVRAGATPSAPLRRIVADFPRQVSTVEGELPGWLFDVADTHGIAYDTSRPADVDAEDVTTRRTQVAQELDERLEAWASSLGPMGALNAVTSLLVAAGGRPDADDLLRRMWTRYRAPSDSSGPAYARYLHNYGELLLRRGVFHNPRDIDHDFLEWKDAADRDPSQFFARAAEQGGRDDSRARMLLCRFLAGANVSSVGGPAAALFESLWRAGVDPGMRSRSWIDAVFSLSELLELLGLGQAVRPLLEDAYQASVDAGDEFRRATAAWRLARNLAFQLESDASAADQVARLADECAEISARLDIRESTAGAALAQSIAAAARRDWSQAADRALHAESCFREAQDVPGEMFAKRERMRALVGSAQDGGALDLAQFDELNVALQQFAIDRAPGLRPLIKFELAHAALFIDRDLARDLASDASSDAELQGHRVLVKAAISLRDQLLDGDQR